MKTKVIKDAVHKYIELEEPFWKTVNTAEFQRLRWIEQTSYRALYPAARHDRFIHSLGVFHLGQKAFASLLESADDEQEKKILRDNKDSFLLACLLHDVGHAPFSHTCEDFFDYKISPQCTSKGIGRELLDAIRASSMSSEEKTTFVNDFTNCLTRGPRPAHHETVSSIIVTRLFDKCNAFFDHQKLSLDLIIRCIIGCTYVTLPGDVEDIKQVKGIKDCLVRLLNSGTSDVDKLDYLARDAQMSGYDNVAIDTNRLVKGSCYVIDADSHQYHPAFKKSALSIIDNVFTAKNSVAKWILNHPTIIYERVLLRRSIGVALKQEAEKNFKKVGLEGTNTTDDFIKSVFSTQSLSATTPQGHPVRLLTDGDILHYIKQANSSDIDELLNRSERRHPVWKSLAEFVHLCGSPIDAQRIVKYLGPLVDICNSEEITNPVVLNGPSELHSEISNGILATLDSFFKSNGVSMDLLFADAKSSFSITLNPEKIFVRFSNKNDFSTFSKLSDSVSGSKSADISPPFFYMFTKEAIDAKAFLSWLLDKIPLESN